MRGLLCGASVAVSRPKASLINSELFKAALLFRPFGFSAPPVSTAVVSPRPLETPAPSALSATGGTSATSSFFLPLLAFFVPASFPSRSVFFATRFLVFARPPAPSPLPSRVSWPTTSTFSSSRLNTRSLTNAPALAKPNATPSGIRAARDPLFRPGSCGSCGGGGLLNNADGDGRLGELPRKANGDSNGRACGGTCAENGGGGDGCCSWRKCGGVEIMSESGMRGGEEDEDRRTMS